MAEISLRAYLAEIGELLDQNLLDEAIVHCRHILIYFPKSLEIYRLLGKALLEQGRHGDAADIFQRVLSAVPDDFVSHVGMAIVREDESNLDAAIFHMERAFEINPANPAIQEELKRLYGRRDGVEPPRIRLTRSALARMYARGNHYEQAIAELRAALAEDPERPDLQVVLAEVCWRADLRADAAETCADILRKLPNCLQANRILADIWAATGREQEALAYRRRVEALDPYEALANRDEGITAADVPASEVRLPKLVWEGEAEKVAAESEQPDWMASLGITLEQPRPVGAETFPDWLQAAPASSPSTPLPAELPAWMQDSTPRPPQGTGALEPNGSSDVRPPELTFSAPDEPVPNSLEDMPDWLREQLGPAAAAFNVASTPGASDNDVGPLPDLENDLPAWMRETSAEEPTAPSGISPAEGLPGWLKPTESPGETAEASQTLPAWFFEPSAAVEPLAPPQAAEHGVPPANVAGPEQPEWSLPSSDELQTAAPAQSEPADWLLDLPAEPSEHAEAVASAQGLPESLSQELLPNWLKEAGWESSTPEQVQASEAQAHLEWEDLAEGIPPTAEPASEIPEWLRALAPPEVEHSEEQWAETPSAFTELPAADANPAPDRSEDLDWLKALQTGPLPSAAPPRLFTGPLPSPDAAYEAAASIPEWLQEPSVEADSTVEQDESLLAWLNPPAEALPPQEQPLSEGPVLAEPAAEAEALPDWLSSMLQAEEGPRSMDLVASTPFTEAAPASPPPPIVPPLAEAPVEEPEVWVAPEEAAQADLASGEPAAVLAETQSSAGQSTFEAPLAPKPLAQDASMDEALAWLESLAAGQGADEAELLTRPEDRPAEIPTWMADSAGAEPESLPAEIVSPEFPAPGDWSDRPEEQAAALPGWLYELPPEEGEPATESPAPASELPDWLMVVEPEGSSSEAAVQPEEEVAEPVSLDREGGEYEPVEVESPALEAGPIESLAELPEWLRVDSAASLMEYATQPLDAGPASEPPTTESVPAVPEAMRFQIAEVEEPASVAPPQAEAAEEWQAPLEASTGAEPMPLETGASVWVRESPPMAGVGVEEGPPAQEPAAVEADFTADETAMPSVLEVMAEAEAEVVDAAPAAALAPLPLDALDRARTQLAAGQRQAALDEYSRMIDAGQHLLEVIADLEKALTTQPDDVALLPVLGDAYMRNNQLQRALDTYRRALEQL